MSRHRCGDRGGAVQGSQGKPDTGEGIWPKDRGGRGRRGRMSGSPGTWTADSAPSPTCSPAATATSQEIAIGDMLKMRIQAPCPVSGPRRGLWPPVGRHGSSGQGRPPAVRPEQSLDDPVGWCLAPWWGCSSSRTSAGLFNGHTLTATGSSPSHPISPGPVGLQASAAVRTIVRSDVVPFKVMSASGDGAFTQTGCMVRRESPAGKPRWSRSPSRSRATTPARRS